MSWRCVSLSALVLVLACGGDRTNGERLEANSGASSRDVGVTSDGGAEVVDTHSPDSQSDSPGSAAWAVEPRPLVTIGVTEGDSLYELASVAGASFLGDSQVVVADAGNRVVRVYSLDGRFIRSIGRRGLGPGEFETLAWASTCGTDTVFTYDAEGARLSRFTSSGQFIANARLRTDADGRPPYNISCGPSGMLVATTWPRPKQDLRQVGPYRTATQAVLLDRAGERIATLGDFAAGERYFLGRATRPRPLGKQTMIAAGSDRILIGTADEYAIEMRSASGGLLDSLRAQAPRRAITDSERARYIDRQVARITDPARRARELSQWKEMKFPDEYPAYGAIVVDDLQRIWIGDFDPVEAPPSSWRVFDVNGRELASVATPAGMEIYEIRGNLLLGRTRGADGVEQIVVHSLRR